MNINTENRVVIYAWELATIPKPALRTMKIVGDITDGVVLPKSYIHVGIAVYKRFHHFQRSGLLSVMEIPTTGRFKCGDIQTTKVASNEFEEWIMDHREKFSSQTYDVVSNNCISFAQAACNFLQVPFEGPQVDLQVWLLKNEKVVKLMEKKINKNPILKKLGVKVQKKPQLEFVDAVDFIDEDSDSSPTEDEIETDDEMTEIEALMESEWQKFVLNREL